MNLLPLDIESALDVVGIALCVLIILFLVYNRIKYRRLVPGAAQGRGAPTDFSAQVATRMLGQESERSLAAIVRTVCDERERLHRLLGQEGARPSATDEDLAVSAPDEPLPNRVNAADTAAKAGTAHRYDDVSRLAASGLNPADISAAINRPLAEVELCLAMDRLRVERAPADESENNAYQGKYFRLVSVGRQN